MNRNIFTYATLSVLAFVFTMGPASAQMWGQKSDKKEQNQNNNNYNRQRANENENNKNGRGGSCPAMQGQQKDVPQPKTHRSWRSLGY